MDNESIISITIIEIVIGFIIWLFRYSKKVEFDESLVYITHRAGETKVSLEKIEKIKATMTSINNLNFWKMSYRNDGADTETVRFIPRWFTGDFDKFLNLVRLKNPNVIIQEWSQSFDIDQ